MNPIADPAINPKKITAIPVIKEVVSFEKSNTFVCINTRIIASNIDIADKPFPIRDFLTLLIKKIPSNTAKIKTELIIR